jgi:hypothetical protein
MAPAQQTLGVNAPAAGAVPTGYENYIQAGDNGQFIPKQDANLDQAGLEQRQVIASRFNQPTAFAGEKTMYSMGGLTQEKPFSADDIAQARIDSKADIYSNYGREELAEQMKSNSLARKASSLQIKKLQADVDDQAAFRTDLKAATGMLGSASTVASQAQELLKAGDREGAAKLVTDWRTKNVPDAKQIRVNENGLLEGSQDGGKTWVQASADKGNVYNPNVVENMINDISSSADEHLNRLMFRHAKSPEALSAMIASTKELTLKNKAFEEGNKQFEKTYGLKNRELDVSEKQGAEKIKLMGDELKQKGLLIPSEIQKNLGIASHYRTANNLQDYQLNSIKSFDAEKTTIIKDLDAKKIDLPEAQRRLNLAGMKYGGKVPETKTMTSTDLKNITEMAMNTPGYDKMPPAKQEEVKQGLAAQLGFASAPVVPNYLDVVGADKGAPAAIPTPAAPGGVQPRGGPTVRYSDYDIKNMGLRQAQSLYNQISSKPVQSLEDSSMLRTIRELQPNLQF